MQYEEREWRKSNAPALHSLQYLLFSQHGHRSILPLMHPGSRIKRDNQVVQYEHDKKVFLDFFDFVPIPEFPVEIEKLFRFVAEIANQHAYIKVRRIDGIQRHRCSSISAYGVIAQSSSHR